MKPAVTEMSVDARVLTKRLMATTVGDSITYAELSDLIGRDVKNGARHLLDTARHRLEMDEHVMFAPIHGIGLKRLNDGGVVQQVGRSVTHIAKAARRGARRLIMCVDYNALEADEKPRYNLHVAQTGVLMHMLKPSTTKKLESSIQTEADTSTAKFLEAVKATIS